MANVAVYNMEGKEVGTIELNDSVFGVEVNVKNYVTQRHYPRNTCRRNYR